MKNLNINQNVDFFLQTFRLDNNFINIHNLVILICIIISYLNLLFLFNCIYLCYLSFLSPIFTSTLNNNNNNYVQFSKRVYLYSARHTQ